MNAPHVLTVLADSNCLMRNSICRCSMTLLLGSYKNLGDSCFQSNQRVKSASGVDLVYLYMLGYTHPSLDLFRNLCIFLPMGIFGYVLGVPLQNAKCTGKGNFKSDSLIGTSAGMSYFLCCQLSPWP